MFEPHDLGGRPGFGPIPRGEDAEAVFVHDWERKVFGMLAGSGLVNTDAWRHALERLPQDRYLRPYWERWLSGLELIAREDDPRVRPGPTRRAAREIDAPARFAAGDRVRVLVDPPRSGHTRMPGYVRGREGLVVFDHGGWVFPDTHAHGEGEQPQRAYCVRFGASELWGEGAESGVSVCVDLFEPYLERA